MTWSSTFALCPRGNGQVPLNLMLPRCVSARRCRLSAALLHYTCHASMFGLSHGMRQQRGCPQAVHAHTCKFGLDVFSAVVGIRAVVVVHVPHALQHASPTRAGTCFVVRIPRSVIAMRSNSLCPSASVILTN